MVRSGATDSAWVTTKSEDERRPIALGYLGRWSATATLDELERLVATLKEKS
jgi:hypothetical protein